MFLLEAMKCFSFSNGEKKDEPKGTKTGSVLSTNSTLNEGDVRRSGSELNYEEPHFLVFLLDPATLECLQCPSLNQSPEISVTLL